MIINLIGQPGAGKTSIAKVLLGTPMRVINVDGDELRNLFANKDYSEAGRRANIQNAYNIAIFLESQGFLPVISLISPYKDLRESLKAKTKVLEFYLKTSNIRGREDFFAPNFEEPETDFITLDTTDQYAETMASVIVKIIHQ